MPEVFDFPSTERTEKLPPHRWSWRPKKNEEKSREAGHDIYEDTPYIEIFIDSKSTLSKFPKAADLQKYRRSLERFLDDNKSEGIIGHRLEEWAPMNRSMVEEMKYHKVRTVEDLADLTDQRAEVIAQGKEWRERARQWLAAAKAAAPVEKVAAENRELKARLEALEKLNARAMKELEQLTAPDKGKKG